MTKEPEKEIIRRGERYCYAGGIPNTKDHKQKTKLLKKHSGRKVVYIDRDERWTRVYISSKFHPETCTERQPWNGTGTLRGEV